MIGPCFTAANNYAERGAVEKCWGSPGGAQDVGANATGGMA